MEKVFIQLLQEKLEDARSKKVIFVSHSQQIQKILIGIKGSPSCGVTAALDINRSAEYIASLEVEKLAGSVFNEYCYQNCLIARAGLFISALKEELRKAQLEIKFFEHDLLAKMRGEVSNLNFTK